MARSRASKGSSKTYSARAFDYAEAVVNGDIDACEWVKLAAKRHVSEIASQGRRAFGFRFDESDADRVCAIAERLPHVKGKWARGGELIRLEDWQCFILCCIFGWKRKDNGRRRFRKVYLKIPRKNGKSILAAIIGLIMFRLDGEYGAEVYCGATTERQAWEVFRPARQMVERSKAFREELGIEVWAKSLACDEDGSRFEPVIGKPGDGSSPSCALIDEFHEHDTPDLIDTMESGMGAREEPLLLAITTAGFNITSPCFIFEKAAEDVLSGTVPNDELFAVMYGIDSGDDWADPRILKKANPNYGVSVFGEFLLAQQRQAMQSTAAQQRFRTKHLNEWLSAKSALFNLAELRACADPMLDIDEVLGGDAWMSADLASKSDLCAEQTIVRKEVGGKPHYYMFGRYWLPETAVDEDGPNHMAYKRWQASGLLHVTEGAAVDFELIDEQMVERAKQVKPQEFVYDPHNAVRLGQKMQAEGIEAIEFIQTPANFTVPLDDLMTAIKDRRFHYDGNEITEWCFSNVVGRASRKGLMAPTKQLPHQKIDGAIAAIMCISRAVDQGAVSLDEIISNPITQ